MEVHTGIGIGICAQVSGGFESLGVEASQTCRMVSRIRAQKEVLLAKPPAMKPDHSPGDLCQTCGSPTHLNLFFEFWPPIFGAYRVDAKTTYCCSRRK